MDTEEKILFIYCYRWKYLNVQYIFKLCNLKQKFNLEIYYGPFNSYFIIFFYYRIYNIFINYIIWNY